MATRHIISGVTFANSIGKALPDIPGLLALGFWGTGGDGINGNRAPGGPTFATIGNAPIYAANYMSVGGFGVRATATANAPVGGQITGYAVTNGGSQYTQAPPSIVVSGGSGSGATAPATVSGGAITALTPGAPGSAYSSAPTVTLSGGNFTGLDSGVTRASVLAGGWSAFVVARVPSAGAGSNIIEDPVSTSTSGFPFVVQMRNLDGLHSNSPPSAITRAALKSCSSFCRRQPPTGEFGYTYSGGAAGTATLYNPEREPDTDNLCLGDGDRRIIATAAFWPAYQQRAEREQHIRHCLWLRSRGGAVGVLPANPAGAIGKSGPGAARHHGDLTWS